MNSKINQEVIPLMKRGINQLKCAISLTIHRFLSWYVPHSANTWMTCGVGGDGSVSVKDKSYSKVLWTVHVILSAKLPSLFWRRQSTAGTITACKSHFNFYSSHTRIFNMCSEAGAAYSRGCVIIIIRGEFRVRVKKKKIRIRKTK